MIAVCGISMSIPAACSPDNDDTASQNNGVTATTTGAARVESSVESTEMSSPSVSEESASEEAATSRSSTSSSTASTTSTSSSSSTSTTTTTTTIDPTDVDHVVPIDPEASFSFTPEAHASYRATDLFVSSGCGTRLVSPVAGVVDEVLANTYDPELDDPATRGGNAVSIIGDDSVRYYLAHFQLIDPAITAGARVTAGQYLGEMGQTGRSGACHVHFGLSLGCPDGTDDWFIRRGVIWPDAYLESWRNGENLSPLAELEEWFAKHPDACSSAENTPYPVG